MTAEAAARRSEGLVPLKISSMRKSTGGAASELATARMACRRSTSARNFDLASARESVRARLAQSFAGEMRAEVAGRGAPARARTVLVPMARSRVDLPDMLEPLMR